MNHFKLKVWTIPIPLEFVGCAIIMFKKCDTIISNMLFEWSTSYKLLESHVCIDLTQAEIQLKTNCTLSNNQQIELKKEIWKHCRHLQWKRNLEMYMSKYPNKYLRRVCKIFNETKHVIKTTSNLLERRQNLNYHDMYLCLFECNMTNSKKLLNVLQLMEVLKDSWQKIQGKKDEALFSSFIEQYDQNEMALYNGQFYNVHMINIK